MRTLFHVIITLTSLLFSCTQNEANKQYVKIATGSPTGIYYTAGIAIADLINSDTQEKNLDVFVKATPGSNYNIDAISEGKFEFGFAQADKTYQASHGIGQWKNAPQSKLRVVCSLYPETVTLLTTANSGIHSVEDLKGKIVSVGPLGSGSRENALDILRYKGMTPHQDFQMETFNIAEASHQFSKGNIDAFFFTVGHPNGTLVEVTNHKLPIRFIPITHTKALIKDAPYYSRVTIPTAFYPRVSNHENVPTVGTLATLLTSADVSDEVVYQMTQRIFNSLETLKAKHPSFIPLNKRQMSEGAFAPHHPGALKYFQESGLIPKQ